MTRRRAILPPDCRTCKQFDQCRQLCEQAERYASQDDVKQKEETIGIPVIIESVKMNVADAVSLTKREREIVTLFSMYRFNRKEVAQYLNISRESLRQHIQRIRQKIPHKVPEKSRFPTYG